MRKISEKLTSAILGVLALASSTTVVAHDAPAADGMEKCYGVVKKGMNDCQTSATACAGSATKDSQPDAFILLPSGMCERIVGGSLTSRQPSKETKK